MEPYVRESGKVVDPRVELRSALASLSFVPDAFPGVLEQLAAADPECSYYWMERSIEREQVLVLSAELRTRGAASALGADIHFYASSEYNSMLTLVGVIPYADASLVFAVNHTSPTKSPAWARRYAVRSGATSSPASSHSSLRKRATG